MRFQRRGTPTGRPHWPEFVVQSESEPGCVQGSYDEWCKRWLAGLSSPLTDMHRQPPPTDLVETGQRLRLLGEGLTANAPEGRLGHVVGRRRVQGPEYRYSVCVNGRDIGADGETLILTREEFELF